MHELLALFLLHATPPLLVLITTSFSIIMRKSPALHATPSAAGSARGLGPVPLALLPPIPLYRRLLRTHRKFLPTDMRVLGDQYIKDEFRLHKNVDNPMHIVCLTWFVFIMADKLTPRSAFLLSGNCMHKKSRVTNGRERKLIKPRLTK